MLLRHYEMMTQIGLCGVISKVTPTRKGVMLLVLQLEMSVNVVDCSAGFMLCAHDGGMLS